MCSTGLDVLHELLRRGVNLNQQVWQAITGKIRTAASVGQWTMACG